MERKFDFYYNKWVIPEKVDEDRRDFALLRSIEIALVRETLAKGDNLYIQASGNSGKSTLMSYCNALNIGNTDLTTFSTLEGKSTFNEWLRDTYYYLTDTSLGWINAANFLRRTANQTITLYVDELGIIGTQARFKLQRNREAFKAFMHETSESHQIKWVAAGRAPLEYIDPDFGRIFTKSLQLTPHGVTY